MNQVRFAGIVVSLLPALITGADREDSLWAQAPSSPPAFRSIAATEHHTCALTIEGAAWCWGLNLFGELGAPSREECRDEENRRTPCSTVPLPVSGGLRFTQITAGGYHNCALTEEGAAWCWGENTFLQLGRDSVPDLCRDPGYAPDPCSRAPMPVMTAARFASLSAGGRFTCGLSSERVLHCWGDASDGALGSDTALTLCGETDQKKPCRSSPVPARIGPVRDSVVEPSAEVAGVRAVATLVRHSCVLLTDGTLFCWGSTMERGHRPPGPALVSLSAAYQKLCGLTAEGAPYCVGQFGTPPFGDPKALRSVDTLTLGGIWPAGTDSTAWRFKSLTVGIDHVCGLREDGSAYCWGDGRQGQLGTGQKRGSVIPLRVVGNLTFSQLSAGGYYTCAVTTDSRLYCWGLNRVGQLGDGSTRDRTKPVPVKVPAGAAQP